VKVVGVVVATAVALALQTTLASFIIRGNIAVDLVLVVVIGAALVGGPVLGLFTGTFAGLVQDALASEIVGIGGFAKTLVGFLAGLVATQFIVARPLPRFVVFFAGSVLQRVVFVAMYALIGLPQAASSYAEVAWQATANAVVGVTAFQLIELLPGAVERRRAMRSRPRR
jgi:rod shape-determining protein MreD